MDDKMVRAPRIVVLSSEDPQCLTARYIVGLTPPADPVRMCLLPTASDDEEDYIEDVTGVYEALGCKVTTLRLCDGPVDGAREILLAQDLIYIGEGRTRRLVDALQEHELAPVLREAWLAGVVLAGVSAGMCALFAQSVCRSADDFYVQLGLGLLRGSVCPHYGQSDRRKAYHKFLRAGKIDEGWGMPEGVCLLAEGANPVRFEAVTADPSNAPIRVHVLAEHVNEHAVATTYLGTPSDTEEVAMGGEGEG